MLVLGISGGLDQIHESRFVLDGTYLHDSAAVLVEDGRVVAGVEEERLNRIKHSNKAALRAARFCMESRGIGLQDLDCIAIYATEEFLNISLAGLYLHKPEIGAPLDARGLYRKLLAEEFGTDFDPSRFRFVQHHTAHAMGSWGLSGFSNSLILSADGAGEDVSTIVIDVNNGQWDVLRQWGLQDSLGIFYLDAIRFLGYELFDEYKVMGLAPYGDPKPLRPHFDQLFSLLPEGGYAIHRERLLAFFQWMMPRRRGEPFTQLHKDYSATLQQVLEEIVFHVLRHYSGVSGRDRLVLSGGVAQNSTLNGKILASGLFRDVYAGPATADSGCAIGAALHAARELDPNLPTFRADQCCWGPLPDREEPIEEALERWAGHIESRRMEDPIAETAALLAEGNVIGWVQGGAEFGPRALGNRSILADPRPASHKELINAMIKKREGYRPFAPSVIEERAGDFFVLPEGQCDFPFMSFVMPVQPAWREQLGAITHIDGTARLQTVSRETNPRFWALISAFGEKTGIPMLLNTSFNNNAEPIVNTTDEAVVCFLDSGLHYLVVGDYLVSRRTSSTEDDLLLTLELPTESRCIQELSCQADGTPFTQCWLQRNYDSRRRKAISQRACDAIRQAGRTLGEILSALGIPRAEYPAVVKELRELWSERQIRLVPKAKKRTA